MTRSIPIVALMLVASVLVGSECFELCSFSSCVRETKAKQASEPAMPCHQHKSSQKKQLPASADCSHQELIAEQRAIEFTPEQGQSSLFSTEQVALFFLPLPASYQSAADIQFFRSPHRESLLFVLRI